MATVLSIAPYEADLSAWVVRFGNYTMECKSGTFVANADTNSDQYKERFCFSSKAEAESSYIYHWPHSPSFMDEDWDTIINRPSSIYGTNQDAIEVLKKRTRDGLYEAEIAYYGFLTGFIPVSSHNHKTGVLRFEKMPEPPPPEVYNIEYEKFSKLWIQARLIEVDEQGTKRWVFTMGDRLMRKRDGKFAKPNTQRAADPAFLSSLLKRNSFRTYEAAKRTYFRFYPRDEDYTDETYDF